MAEGGSLVYTINRTTTGVAETVNFSLGGTATRGSDYASPGTSVSFGVNDTSKTVTITTLTDAVAEGNETVDLTLTGTTGSGTLGTPASASGTITDATGTGVTIVGTAGADLITPFSTVPGQPFPTAFDETIFGLGGNDTLNGGLGTDPMEGSYGNDTYYVDNPGDTVVELSGRGMDTSVTGLSSYSLASNAFTEALR